MRRDPLYERIKIADNIYDNHKRIVVACVEFVFEQYTWELGCIHTGFVFQIYILFSYTINIPEMYLLIVTFIIKYIRTLDPAM